MPTLNNFSDLKKVSTQLKKEAEQRAKEAQEALARSKEAKAQADYFAQAMAQAGVSRMAQKNQADVHRPKPEPIVKNLNPESTPRTVKVTDQGDPGTFLTDENGRLAWRRDLSPDLPRKLYRGFWTVQAWIDLHGYQVEEARVHLLDFILESSRRGYRCLRVVHGVGYNSQNGVGKLKDLVPRWLKQFPGVMAFAESPVNEGSQGALLVLLEKND